MSKYYWNEDTDEKLAEYIATKDEELFEKELYPKIKKIVENILLSSSFRDLIVSFSAEEMFSRAISHLYEILEKWNSNRSSGFTFLSVQAKYFYWNLRLSQTKKTKKEVSFSHATDNNGKEINTEIVKVSLQQYEIAQQETQQEIHNRLFREETAKMLEEILAQEEKSMELEEVGFAILYMIQEENYKEFFSKKELNVTDFSKEIKKITGKRVNTNHIVKMLKLLRSEKPTIKYRVRDRQEELRRWERLQR